MRLCAALTGTITGHLRFKPNTHCTGARRTGNNSFKTAGRFTQPSFSHLKLLPTIASGGSPHALSLRTGKELPSFEAACLHHPPQVTIPYRKSYTLSQQSDHRTTIPVCNTVTAHHTLVVHGSAGAEKKKQGWACYGCWRSSHSLSLPAVHPTGLVVNNVTDADLTLSLSAVHPTGVVVNNVTGIYVTKSLQP